MSVHRAAFAPHGYEDGGVAMFHDRPVHPALFVAEGKADPIPVLELAVGDRPFGYFDGDDRAPSASGR